MPTVTIYRYDSIDHTGEGYRPDNYTLAATSSRHSIGHGNLDGRAIGVQYERSEAERYATVEVAGEVEIGTGEQDRMLWIDGRSMYAWDLVEFARHGSPELGIGKMVRG